MADVETIAPTIGVTSLRLTHLRGVNALSALLGGAAEQLYATLTVAGRFLGRTPIFSTLDGDVELPDLYGEVVVPTTREPIPVVVEFFRLPRPAPPLPDAFGHLDVRETTPVTTPLRAFRYNLPFPWASGTHDLGEMPGITLSTTTDLVPVVDTSIVAPRAIGAGSVRATAGIREAITARFVQITGLHRPTGAYLQGERNSIPAGEDYGGEDHLGRIFISHDRGGMRIREGQSIAVRVALDVVTPFPPAGEVFVRFRVIDVDDPSDDRRGVASRFRGYLDPKDHNRRDEGPYGTPLGPHGHDNEGRPTSDPPWEATPDYALVESSSVAAMTIARPIDALGMTFETEVILHCPSLPGDAFILEVEADVDGFETFVRRTGVLTMWQRIDLQPYVLATVIPVVLRQMVRRLESVYFQVDIANDILVDHDDTIEFSEHGTELIDLFDSLDAHAGEPGWFGVVFYRHLIIPDERAGLSLNVGYPYFDDDAPIPATLGRGKPPETEDPEDDPGPLANYVDIDAELGVLSTLQEIVVEIATPPVGEFAKPHFLMCTVASIEVGDGRTRLWIEPVQLNPLFVAGQGKIDFEPISYKVHPSFHRKFNAKFAEGPGNEIPEGKVIVNIRAEIPLESPRPSVGILGICPARWIGGAEYFANVIFVVDDEVDGKYFWDKNILADVAQHELGHSLGFPHRCGYVSADAGTCPMQYSGDWSFVDGTFTRLHPYVGVGLEDRTYCPRHQREMRRTILEDHPAYRWWST